MNQKIVFLTLKKVFGQKKFFWLAVISALIFYDLLILLPNFNFYFSLFWEENFSKLIALKIMFNTLLNPTETLSWGKFFGLVLTAILFGVNLSLAMFALKKGQKKSDGSANQTSKKEVVVGGLGATASIVGLSCLSCGGIVAGALGTILGSGTLLALPFGGGEFIILGILLLIFSIIYLAKKIGQNPLFEVGVKSE